MENYILPETSLLYAHTDKDMRYDRKSYLGGSDSDAFGSDIVKEPYLWSTPFIVFCKKKKYRVEPDNPAMKRGRDCEARLRDNTSYYLEQRFHKRLEAFRSPATYRMREYPFVGANIDGVIKDEDGVFSGLEIKTTSYSQAWLENNYDGIPFSYWSQVQHYMLVTSLPRFYFVCGVLERLVEGVGSDTILEVIIRKTEANPEFQKALLEAYKDFWENNILKDVPPELGGISREAPYIDSLPSKHLIGSSEQVKIIDEYMDAKKKVKELRDVIASMVGESKYLIAGKWKCTLRKMETKRFSSSKFRDDYPELYENYRELTETENLYIQRINKSARTYALTRPGQKKEYYFKKGG